MFVSSNNLKDLLTYFKRKLKSIYDEAEVENIFFLVCDEVFQCSKIQVINNDIRLSESDLLRVKSIVDRLLNNEPIQHIIGHTYFFDCLIKVSADVLIPRPETEELVDLIIKMHHQSSELSILDIGTGSGCIPIALKKKLKSANLTAIDVSKKALELALENAKNNQVEINFLNIDIFSSEAMNLPVFEIIISNPPYIPVSDKLTMHKNVLDFEPDLALFVTDNAPLIFYERIIELSKSKLTFGGKLYFEIHHNFGTQVKQLLLDNNFSSVKILKDLQGQERFCIAIK